MAIAAEPLRYIRRYLLVEETILEKAPAVESADDENLVREAG
jgi:hypothetical protein